MVKTSTLLYVLEHLNGEESTILEPADLFTTPDTDLSDISVWLDRIEYEPDPALIQRIMRVSGIEG